MDWKLRLPNNCLYNNWSADNSSVFLTNYMIFLSLNFHCDFDSESGQMCAIKEVRLVSDDRTSKECLKQLNQVTLSR